MGAIRSWHVLELAARRMQLRGWTSSSFFIVTQLLQHSSEAVRFDAHTKRESAFLAGTNVSVFLCGERALNQSDRPEPMQRYVVASLSRQVIPSTSPSVRQNLRGIKTVRSVREPILVRSKAQRAI